VKPETLLYHLSRPGHTLGAMLHNTSSPFLFNTHIHMHMCMDACTQCFPKHARVCFLYCLSNVFDRLSNHFGFCVCVCPQIGCRTITSAILYLFSPNFACCSEIWLFRTLLFLGQTGSRLPILEMCKIRFWHFRDCGGYIFPRIVTKNGTEI